jgi:hypothetical protein
MHHQKNQTKRDSGASPLEVSDCEAPVSVALRSETIAQGEKSRMQEKLSGLTVSSQEES